MSDIKFIPIANTDSEVQEKVRIWSNKEEIRKYMIYNHYIKKEEHENWIKDVGNRDDIKIWVAFMDEVPFGLLKLSSISKAEGTTDWGLYIGEDGFLGQGLSKVLLFNLIDHAFESLNLKKMYTEVFINNTVAAGLYKKFGFEHVPNSERVILCDGLEIALTCIELDRYKWQNLKQSILQNNDIPEVVLP